MITSASAMFTESSTSSSHDGIGTIIRTTRITDAPAIRIGIALPMREPMVCCPDAAGACVAI